MFPLGIRCVTSASTCTRIGLGSLLILFSLWLRAGYLPMGVWGGHDDALFLRLARNLGQGQWLGPYDQLTLAKGAFFPVFLLLGKASGLPLKLVEHLLYVLTAMLAATTVLRLTGMRWLAAMVALVLVFSPVPWMFEGGSRVTREPIYQVMTLAILLISVRYFLLDNTRPAVGLVLGVLGGCYWLTREEGVWLLPSLAILLLPCVLRLGRNVFCKSWPALAGDLRRMAFPLAGFLALVMSVNAVNQFRYGIFRNNDFRSGPFADAYASLARIGHDGFKRFVTFPREARARAYAVSPAARELATYLDGSQGIEWTKASQQYPAPWGCNESPGSCNDEILSAWFVWALRDAVAAAGHYRSANEADAYYRQLAMEIDAACDSGAIPCDRKPLGLMPKWRNHYLSDGLAASMTVLGTLMRLNGGNVGVPPSGLSAEQASVFRYAINSPISGDVGSGVFGTGPLHDARIAVTRAIGRFYSLASQPLLALALAGHAALLLCIVGKRRSLPPGMSRLAMVLSALLVAIVARVVLLGFLEAMAIPSNNFLYLLPVAPIYLLFVVLGCGAAFCALAGFVRRWRSGSP